jgi:CrcB protein
MMRRSLDGWGLSGSFRRRRPRWHAPPRGQPRRAHFLGPGFPYGTLIVNVAGGLLMGVMAELFLVKGGGSQELRLFLTTGFLGGFTTFSAFSLDAALMWERSDYAALGAYVTGSVLFSIAALFLGMAAVRSLA